jgi:CO/xanthine dehydrogenase FAD-binding subunit
MRPAPFHYHRPDDLDHALTLLAQFGDDARPLAGGQSLVPMMNLRLARPEHLIDINALPLNDIEMAGPVMRVGALVRHEKYLGYAPLATHFPAFHEAVAFIGHPTIRRHGSLGGSISHADPTAELPAVCVLYDAVVVARSLRGERRIASAEFFLGAYTTALEPDELVIAVEFPLPDEKSTGCFIEVSERRGDFATASVGVALEFAGNAISKAAIVCSGAELRPIRTPEVEALLSGSSLDDPPAAEAGRLLAAGIDPISNHVASAEYRRSLVGELTKRAIASACTKAMERS